MIHAGSAMHWGVFHNAIVRSGCVATIQAGRRPSHLAPTEPTAGRERILAILRVQCSTVSTLWNASQKLL